MYARSQQLRSMIREDQQTQSIQKIPGVGDMTASALVAALNGILFVLQTGIPWEDLPKELGLDCGMTCWRRLRHWQASGVWAKLH
jgi:transposase